MQEAVAAVEAVERKRASRKTSAAAEDEDSWEENAVDGDGEADGGDGGDGEVERLRQEVVSLKDMSLRTLADFDNYRKRVERERQVQQRYALMDPLREFLPVIDNLERALGAQANLEDLRVGIDMVHRQMLDLLGRFGAKPVAAEGEPFDPNVHDAVSRVEDDEAKVPMVREEHQKGYMLHERLLRPAMVTVAMPPAPPTEAAEPEAEPED
jgi:molecular chaperone GrpE